MTISTLPAAPSRNDSPDVFVGKSDTFVAALQTLVTEINATVVGFNVTKWITGTTYGIGDLTWSPIDYQTYRRKTAGAGTTDPSADTTNWALQLISGAAIQAQTYTAFTTGGTSGSFTLSPAPALGSYIANQRFRVKFHTVGNGSDNLNISGLGNKALKQYDQLGNKRSPRIYSGMQTDVEYDGTDLVIRDPVPAGALLSDTWYATPAANQVTLILGGQVSPSGLPVAIFTNNQAVVFSTTGALLSPLVAGTIYYTVKSTGSNFYVAAEPDGAPIVFTGTQSGTQTISNAPYNKATNNPARVLIEMVGPGAGGGNVTAVAGAAGSGGAGGNAIVIDTPASRLAAGNITLTTPIGGTPAAAPIAGTSADFFGTGSISTGIANPGLTSSAASVSKQGGAPDVNGIPAAVYGNSAMPGVAPLHIDFFSGDGGGASFCTAAVATAVPGTGGAAALYSAVAVAFVGATTPGNSANSFGSGGSGALGATANNGGHGRNGCIRIREYA